MCHFIANFFHLLSQMKLISRLLTCSFKNKIHFLLSSTLFSSLAASRRHSYNVVFHLMGQNMHALQTVQVTKFYKIQEMD